MNLFSSPSALSQAQELDGCQTQYSPPHDNDITHTPPDDRKMQDVEEGDELEDNNSLSDFGEEDEDIENLQQTAAKSTRDTLARTETKAVSCLRYVVIIVLLSTAIGVSLATFFYSRSVEEQSFEGNFEGVAAMTVRSFAEAVEHRLGALDVLATGVTSHAVESGETFPNVTVPDFHVRGAQVRTQTDGIYVFYTPLVTDETRKGYEAYSQMTWMHIVNGYMSEEGMRQYQDSYFGIEMEETKEADAAAEEATADEVANQKDAEGGEAQSPHEGRLLHVALPEEHPTIHDRIWGLGGGDWLEPEGAGPYLPMWQLSPIIPLPSIVNFNFLDYVDIAPMMIQTVTTGKAVLSYIQTNHSGGDTADLIRTMMTLNQYRHQNVSYNDDPMTQVAYPVFDSFSPWNKQVSGLVMTTIFWRLLFANILPTSVKGVVCVLSNTLGESITYQINGRDVIYLGTGDRHDGKYDSMVVSEDIGVYLKERAGPLSTSYTAVELDAGYTSYTLEVYPSQTMEDTYITSNPMIYAVVVAFVFAFTSLVFLLYDRIVERRQAKVMDKAVKSTAVVTSLFPEAVHERLFADAPPSTELIKEMQAWKATSSEMEGNLQRQPTVADLMRSSGNRNAPSLHQPLPGTKVKGRPIADKFPNTTVLFADLAGFTQWSSNREPEHVFILLETLYGAFDKVALRRQVFKVETIGDCYMACTGLPNPQPDHAVRMVKFARDCMQRMQRIVEDLSITLGPDTKDLAMRVGLNSGPVTAGVLRGDKGRFQLFGDTVNTASRMESNGVKGRIHVSESTANLLPVKWLTCRQDKIVAKGKGEMTTYFVEANVGARSSVTSGVFESGETEGETSNDDQTIRDSNASVNTNMHGVGDGTNANLHRINDDIKKPHDFCKGVSVVEGMGARAITIEDEPEQSRSQDLGLRGTSHPTRRFSPVGFVKSVADKLGISDEVEV